MEQHIIDLEYQNDVEEVRLADIPKKDLPQLITQEFDKISKLEERVQKARDSAVSAKESARIASIKSASLGHKKEAIEALQSSNLELAKANGDIIDALDVSFDYQKQLGQITQYLFLLGVSNIAYTKFVIQQLKEELKKAPKDKLSDTAREEIIKVIRRLKEQEDLALRMSEQGDALKKHEGKISTLIQSQQSQDDRIKYSFDKIRKNSEKNKEQDARLDKMQSSDDAQDELIQGNSEKNKEQDARLDKMQSADDARDKLIQGNSEKNKEQDARLDKMQSADDAQDELIQQNADKNREQDESLNEVISVNNEQSNTIRKQGKEIENLKAEIEGIKSELETKGNRILLIATSIASAGALVISILQFFI